MGGEAPRVAAVVLAAGGSSRLGFPKQLVHLLSKSLLRMTIGYCAEAGCSPVVVVLGAYAERVRREVPHIGVQVVVNDHWRDGMASSIHAGVTALPDDTDAVILTVCDQPRLATEVLVGLRDAYDRTPGRMVASEYAGTVGVPALFGRDRFRELLELSGDQGAKPLLERHADSVLRVPWADGAVDVDRPHPSDPRSRQGG